MLEKCIIETYESYNNFNSYFRRIYYIDKVYSLIILHKKMLIDLSLKGKSM